MAIPRPNRQVTQSAQVAEVQQVPIQENNDLPVSTVPATTSVVAPQNDPVVVQSSTAVSDTPIVIRRDPEDSPFRHTSDDDRQLLEKLRRLNPAQRARLRSMSVNEGLIPQGAQKLADGSMRVTMTISPDEVPQLEAWAEAAGKTTEEQAVEIIQYLLSSYLHGEWVAPEPVVAGGGNPAAPVPPAGTPAPATT